MSGLVATWGGDLSSDLTGLVIEKVDRGMLGGVLDSEVPMPGRAGGAWVFPSVRGNRTILARSQVVAPIDGRRARVAEVAAWLDKAGYQDLYFSDQPDRFWRAYLAVAPPLDEWRHQGKFAIEWRAEPYAYSSTLSEEVIATGASPDSGSFVVADLLGATPIIEISPVGGSIATGFTWTLNGYTLTVNGPISEGATQTISTVSFTITGGQNAEAELNGAYDASPQWTVDASGEFPLLVSGTNNWSIEWDGSATSVGLHIYWRERLY